MSDSACERKAVFDTSAVSMTVQRVRMRAWNMRAM